MSNLTFFRQTRNDGGIRTGVEVDDTLLLHCFEEGNDEDDPSIAWFIDLRFEGPEFSHEAEGARAFLLDRQNMICSALAKLAEELNATGVDAGAWPLQRPLPAAGDGVSLTLVCSALRRLDGRHIGGRLTELASKWASIVSALPAEPQWVR